jgi:hypothetical protein
VPEPAPGDAASQRIGVALSDQEAAALADWYADIARAVAEFPQADLKAVEPPLRSTPGPPP